MPDDATTPVDTTRATLARFPHPAVVGAVAAIVWVLAVAALPGGSSDSGVTHTVGRHLATGSGRFAAEHTGVFRVYLAPQGSDNNDGLAPERAVSSLTAAQRRIAAARPRADVEVRIKQGIYVAPQMDWSTYLPGHTITFLPLDYEFGKGIEDTGGRPIFRGDGKRGFWLRAVPQSGGQQRPTRLRFYFLQVERYSAGAIAFDGGRPTDGQQGSPPPSAAANGHTIYGMAFRNLGSRYVRDGVGFGAIDLINSSNNIIQNNSFEYLENLGSLGDQGLIHGVYLSHHSSNNVISDNRFYRISGDPIRTRDNSNENKAYGNTFKRAGSNAYYSDWFAADADADESDGTTGQVECASRGNEFYNNLLISGYRGRIDDWWTNPLGVDYAARDCRNDGQGRVRAWGNRRG